MLFATALCLVAIVSALAPSESYHAEFLKRTAAVRERDPTFDCAWSQAAYLYAKTLQPWQGAFQSVYDALQLQLCNQDLTAAPNAVPQSSVRSYDVPPVGPTFYVDPVAGSDSNSGTLTSPFRTIARAVAATRAARADGPANILLRAGTHYLTDTIALGPEDSFLTIQSYNGENAIVSGGQLLTIPAWNPVPAPPPQPPPAPPPPVGSWIVEPLENAVYGGSPGKDFRIYGKLNSWQDCQQACQTNNCDIWTWHDQFQTGYELECWFRLDGVWDLTPESGHTSGCQVGRVAGCGVGPPPPPPPAAWNAYVADLSGQGITEMLGMQVDGIRAILARYPNGNPETTLFPDGWIAAGTNWVPPLSYPNPRWITVTHPQRNNSDMFQEFMLGVGGPCSIYDPPVSYWCSQNPSGGGAFTFRVPSGLYFTKALLPNAPYKNATGALVDVWRPSHWANWFFEVAQQNVSAGTLTWTKGGFQGARGDNTGAEWYISNVVEELDAPGEFFYDTVSQKLYYFSNSTGAPNTTTSFVAAKLKTLFSINGTQDAPVRAVNIRGLTLTAAAATYMDAHSVPSGGDWGLQRMGAVFIQGTENVEISGNLFTRLDGNGLMLSGYNRDTTIQYNEFVWIGDTAAAAWGMTVPLNASQDLTQGNGISGLSGSHPQRTRVMYNVMHEMGLYEKQSSCWFQAKTAETLLEGNVCFNGPRAGFNINDGFGGGNELVDNLLFNMCRETSDHGPFNSWDRQPFLTDILDGTPQFDPAYNNIHHNFMVANYGANGGCVDNDDGSSWYNLHDNFFVYGGHKSDFGGHNKRSFNNLDAYPSVYGTRCIGVFNMPLPGGAFNEGYWNNTCILPDSGDHYGDLAGFNCGQDPAANFAITMHDNRIFVPDGLTYVSCGGTFNFTAWQAFGFDKGSVVIPTVPSSEQIITWARALLGF